MEPAIRELPVPVLALPHWRVNIRPTTYRENLIPSLSKCFEVVEQTKVRLRGWDYPHLSSRSTQRGQGANWIASWSNAFGHNEYWRFYQSGQFLHLFSVREHSETDFHAHLEKVSRTHHYLQEPNWPSVKGYISLLNFVYTVTEIFEFGARLSEKDIYQGDIEFRIDLRDIAGFLLTVEANRAWHSCYQSSEDHLGNTWMIRSDVLIAESAKKSLDAIVWFFERFGWMNPPIEALRSDQEQLIKGLI
ncbi:MAG TPA: hypothetical protein VGH16_21185 [Candidatus Binatia bacterium]